ncbi:SRPBCC family protein [Marinicellulosiphila megalodicopiae]|uniref:SRPBCC family protein n=1 Tax=Marinicellulosiphila megalodicopiae TaxID=2724896 RepID=UPI003BAF1679
MKPTQAKGPYQAQAKITIKASQAKTWALLSEFDNVYKWVPSIKESYGMGKKEVGLGHSRHCKIKGFGGIDEHITVWEEGEGFEYEISPVGPLHGATSRWELSTTENGDTLLTVTLVYSIRLSIIGKMMHKLMMRNKLKNNLDSIVKTVQSVLEDEHASKDFFAKDMKAA